MKIYELLEPFGLHSIRIDLGHWAIGHPFFTQAQVPGETAAALIVAGTALAAVTAAVRAHAERPGLTRGLVLVLVLAAAAPVGVALYSVLHESVWSARNVISSWPGFAVLLGGLITYPKLPWRAGVLALVLAGYLVGGLKLSQASNQRPDYDSAASFIDHSGYPDAPVVDLVAPTPGPPTETEAALSLEQPDERHPVLRLGLAPMAEVLRVPAYTGLPAPSGLVIARQAAARAGDGVLFLVAPTSISIAAVQATRARHITTGGGELGDFVQFLGALHARFRLVEMRTYAGFAAVSVYVFRG